MMTGSKQWLTAVTVAVGALSWTGCGEEADGAVTAAPSARGAALESAARAHGVPPEVLAVYGWQVGRLQAAPPHVEPSEGGGHVFEERFGWMHLTEEQVRRAAALIRQPEHVVQADDLFNAEAAAALLREQVGPGEVSWSAWLQAASGLAGLVDGHLREGFEADLAATLGEGLQATFEDGEVLAYGPLTDLPALKDAEWGAVDQALTAPGQYPPMKWQAAHPNNYIAGRSGGKVRYVIVHMTEGSYYGTLQWFSQANPYQSSTHYVIKSSNGEITQMVGEANAAWHAGNNYYSLNSIGIEHEGYVSNLSAWFTEAMYQSSAKLVCAIVKKHGLPVNSQTIIGHFQVPNPNRLSASAAPATWAQWTANRYNYGGASNHFDPSYGTSAWNWNHYLNLVQTCVNQSNGTTPPPTSPNPTKPANPIVCSGSACWPGNDLEQGDTGPRVYSLQTALVYLGHLHPGTALSGPGIFGPATKAAVIAFQQKSGVPTTGYYGIQTATALGNALKANPPAVPSQNLWVGLSGSQVTQLQQRLAQVGYNVPATGYYGTMTRDAVRQFQDAHYLPGADGSYGALTRMALAAHFAKGF